MAKILAELEDELNGYNWDALGHIAWDDYGIDGWGYDSKAELIEAILRIEYINGSR